jgi:hypothetical protein
MSEHAPEAAARSMDDRRDSPRIPVRIRVRRADSADPFDLREGNVSLGGFAWFGGALPVGTRVEASLMLPGTHGEVVVRGEVLNVGHGGRGSSAHVRFLELPEELELRIARYLDDVELMAHNPRGQA